MIVDLTVRFVKENPRWGCDCIQGALANVGYRIADTTVSNILKRNGIEPALDRRQHTSWSTFLKAHWDALAAVDFTTVEVWTRGGLVTFYLLFVMELKTRRVQFVGCTTNPNETWMKQKVRELTACDDGFLNGQRFVIMDRDATFCESFRSLLDEAGVAPVRLPPKSPNLNAYRTKITDAGLARLKQLTELEVLTLSQTQITDAGLMHLKGLTNLVVINLEDTKVTDAGIAELKKALPKCQIRK